MGARFGRHHNHYPPPRDLKGRTEGIKYAADKCQQWADEMKAVNVTAMVRADRQFGAGMRMGMWLLAMSFRETTPDDLDAPVPSLISNGDTAR